MRLAAGIVLVLAIAGCDEPAATQVLVHIDAEPLTRVRADALHVRVYSDGEPEAAYDQRRTLSGPSPEASFPATVPVVPRGGDATRGFRLVAELIDADGVAFASRETRETFVADTLREVTLLFEDVITDAGMDGSPDADTGFDAPICDCACAGDTCTADGCVPARPMAQVGGGLSHACAVGVDGALFCWGQNDDGQLGMAVMDFTPRTTPTLVPAALVWEYVEPSEEFTCGLTTSGEIYCWGRNRTRQLGIGSCCSVETGDQQVPTLTETAVTYARMTTGGGHGCAIGESMSGRVYCWGGNESLQCGNDTMTAYAAPRPAVDSDRDWQSISAGDRHTCGIKTTGALFCWGEAANGRLGNGDFGMDTHIRQLVDGTWQQVSAGENHTCAVAFDGTLSCWGRSAEGQLGVGAVTDRLRPAQVGPGLDWESVSAGRTHTCGIRGPQVPLFCWGTNVGGELGVDGAGAGADTPAEVGPGWASVVAADNYTCAITRAGALYCWGANLGSRLGLGDTTDRREPTRVCTP